MHRIGQVVKLLSLGLLGGLLVLLRYILKTPQPLESALPGESHIYKWTYGHVYYKALGARDAPPLVLLHAPGIGASAYEMRHIVADLARSYRIYVPDLPGFGLSDHPDIDYSADTYIALYQDFLRDVVGGPAELLASGLSCNYAVAVAINVPELCLHLHLLSPIALFQRSGSRLWLQGLTRFSLSGLLIYALLTPCVILRRVIAWQYALDERQLSDDDLDYAFAAAHQLGAQYAALAFINGKLGLDVSRQLEALQRPASLIWGVSALRRVQSVVPQYRIAPQVQTLSLPDGGRYVHEASPHEVIAAILRWHEASEQAHDHARTAQIETDGAFQAPLPVSSTTVPPENAPSTTAQNNLRAEVTPPVETPGKREQADGQPENANIEAYCLKCKQKRAIQNAKRTETRNGRSAMEGTCPVCGTKIMRFVSA